jgi:shikimate kinase
VFLVGFMGSGKSTVGRELAHRLNWNFIDLDAQIEARERQSIPEIFRTRGEPAFRQAETAVLRELLATATECGTIVALGGGVFAQETNRQLLRESPTVFLRASAEELWRRCVEDGVERPLRHDPEQFARLYAERLPLYCQATVTVETSGKQLLSICSEIEDALRLTRAPASLEGKEVSGESQ